MSSFIDFNSLNSSDLNTLIETNNIIPALLITGSKESDTTITSNATYTEAILLICTVAGTSISIPTYTGTTNTKTCTKTTAHTGINIVVIENSNIQLIDSFTNAEIVQFYKDVLNAIDNMILLDYIRDYVMPQKIDTVNYFVTKTLDVNLDLALAYYAIKYPNDTSVDTIKLQELIVIIEAFYCNNISI